MTSSPSYIAMIALAAALKNQARGAPDMKKGSEDHLCPSGHSLAQYLFQGKFYSGAARDPDQNTSLDAAADDARNTARKRKKPRQAVIDRECRGRKRNERFDHFSVCADISI